jgi:serralysin
MGYSDLMGAVINAILGSSASNAAAVDLLYTNVVGVAPSANDLAFFTDWLDKGIYTKASFGVLAADTDLNIVNVGLVGLASTGLEYTPYVA